METIKLDLIPGKKMPSLHASQYDDGRDYHIDLTENRVPYTLDGTETISVIIRKCDNTLVSMDIANTFANKSYLEFEVVEQMTACAGFNYGEIILEKNGDRLGSLNFYLVVETAPDENGITSQSEIKNLNRQITEEVDRILPDKIAEEVPQAVDDYIGDNYYNKEQTDELLEEKIGKVDIPSYNIFDGSILPIDGNIGVSGFTPAQYYKTTAPVYLDAGSYYYTIKFATFGTGSSRYAKTNQQATSYTVLNATQTAYTVTMSGTEYTIYGFTVSEAGYFAFNLGNAVTARDFMLTRQSDGIPDHYVPYREVIAIESGVSLSDTLKGEVLELTNPLYKKNISADGDSICWGKSYLGGFAKLISEKNSMGYQNLSVAGATLTAEQYIDSNPRHWVCRSMQNLSNDADYIIIEGGVNDSSLGVALGSITNGYNATLDDTTFYGAVETICKTLVTKYVGKKSGFVIPHRMSIGMYPNGNYNNAIKECGIKWGIPVLDLSESVPPFNSFRDTTTYDTIREAYTTNGDGWHPTEICYRQYYVPQIEAWLKTL